jgi:hypothetical protein
MFNASTPIDFAGNTTIYASNTIKINVIVQRWPFYALTNSLAVIFNSTKNLQKNCAKEFVDDNGNLRWVTVSLGDLSLYPQELFEVRFILSLKKKRQPKTKQKVFFF